MVSLHCFRGEFLIDMLREKLIQECRESLRWLRGDAGAGRFQFQLLLLPD